MPSMQCLFFEMNRMLNMHKMRRVLNIANTFRAHALAGLGIWISVENDDVEWGKLAKQRNLKDGFLVFWVRETACVCLSFCALPCDL